ncbi:type IV pilus modification protein PilV [Luteibacter sp. 329MFSha]|uniref:type IV pilus modification protein PilV n=1 Tax=Luteibacter sp. 329MFSha TaxID=1798239 RepID=UPI0008C2C494|nr:type IV pilus modification protein PilV [Luteibacter sp. 329MFSha]SEV85223.1 type IV pilus assembly protein PilV [Luteibacter sp. 329MFSha]
MARIRSRRASRGVSLIEVLMAVLIFSLGLIGLAGLLIVSTRSNQAAFVRTQVTFLAGSMADRMRANPYGLWKDYYSGTYPATGTLPACDTAAPCGPEKIATRDKLIWTAQLQAFLPSLGPSSITCAKAADMSYDATSSVAMRPPFGGTCTMVITWAERGLDGTDDKTADGNLQSLTWVFQP